MIHDTVRYGCNHTVPVQYHMRHTYQYSCIMYHILFLQNVNDDRMPDGCQMPNDKYICISTRPGNRKQYPDTDSIIVPAHKT